MGVGGVGWGVEGVEFFIMLSRRRAGLQRALLQCYSRVCFS